MPQIGRKIYYERTTGNIIQDTGERSGSVIETTPEQDFASYQALAERVPETVGLVQLEYGEYSQDFMACNGYRVDVSSEAPSLVFNFPPEPGEEEPEEPAYQFPTQQRVTQLEAENAGMALELAQNQIRFDQMEQANADLLFALVDKGVL